LFEILDDVKLPHRDPNAPLRIPVMDKMKDKGVLVFGKVESGTVKMGTKMLLRPNDLPA
jgi:peptide chain release factor subunit 3